MNENRMIITHHLNFLFPRIPHSCVVIHHLLFFFLFNFSFIFKLYNIVLVLSNIKMNPPQVYPRSCVPHPEPSSLLPPLPSLWVFPVHQPQASSTVHRTFFIHSALVLYQKFNPYEAKLNCIK